MAPPPPPPPPLRSLDLFSGIGGLTLALRGVAEPVAYCDIEPTARAVLEDRMARGLLPRAPVSDDVQTLTPAWLRARGAGRPQAVVAGFPCVGFSSAGLREGFANEASGLFREILRIVDENPTVAWLFLENVPHIVNIGMGDVIRELHLKRGLELRWCVVAARDVGAPQMRRRWYCVASRPGARLGAELPALPASAADVAHARRWRGPLPERTLCPGGLPPGADSVPRPVLSGAFNRNALLGNSVVPDAARFAFLHLLHLRARGGEPSGPGRTWPASRDPPGGRYPQAGAVLASKQAHACAPPAPPNPRAPVPVRLDARLYAPPEGHEPRNRLDALRGESVHDYWSTPRAQLLGAAQVVTRRTAHDLPTQVRYAVDTPAAERRCMPPHPRFVEWLMGYPRDWTRAAADVRSLGRRGGAARASREARAAPA
jgi:site-specific DNA-cytosine methylase